jgi:Glycosyl transferase family 2
LVKLRNLGFGRHTAHEIFVLLSVVHPTSLPVPIVTVIALCYNHAAWVRQALDSVGEQTYPQIQLIVVDDGSTDHSVAQIRQWLASHPDVLFLELSENKGNCAAFNQALDWAQGKYVIDLACDDLLLPERVARQVAFFESLPTKVGMIYGNTYLVDAEGQNLDTFYPIPLKNEPPSGDIYAQILAQTFISAPTVMFRKSVLDTLGGYDENLAYEDFDIWLRIARQHEVLFQNEILTQKRKLPNSLGGLFYRKKNPLMASSLRICQKVQAMNRLPEETQALGKRVRFFLRQCLYSQHYDLAPAFAQILIQTRQMTIESKIVLALCRLRLPVFILYQWFDWIRQKI